MATTAVYWLLVTVVLSQVLLTLVLARQAKLRVHDGGEPRKQELTTINVTDMMFFGSANSRHICRQMNKCIKMGGTCQESGTCPHTCHTSRHNLAGCSRGCSCCMPITTAEVCAEKMGFCVETGNRCNGTIDMLHNTCEDHCSCCVPDKPVPADEQCTERNGFCIEGGDRCKGTINIIYNSGEDFCYCCIQDQTTTVSPTCPNCPMVTCPTTTTPLTCTPCITTECPNCPVVTCPTTTAPLTCTPCIPTAITTTETTTMGYCDTLRTTICLDGSRCHANATCSRFMSGYICRCNIGHAGDGADCGLDSDIDTWPDVDLSCCKVQDQCSADNCPAKPNFGQEDLDHDGVGDACDNFISATTTPPTTPFDPNFCTPHNTNNKCSNTSDVWKTQDSDGDGHMDSCDNCPNVSNVDQTDSDSDNVGDVCDTDQDADKDGYDDGVDNCLNVVNPDQSDADHDGIGDKCDDDADDDGIPNTTDNCWLVPNPGQEDASNDGTGDACQIDKDGDCIADGSDICPENPMINSADFRRFFEVNLRSQSGTYINWEVLANGKEITQTLNSDAGLMYGQHSFSGVDFDGTFFIARIGGDNDYAGFTFAYQSSKTFYVVMWKKGDQRAGKAGLQIKKVHSITGPSKLLAYALWDTRNTTDQVTLLWHDPNKTPWVHDTSYRWQLIHRPHIGLIRFRFLTGSAIIADSGNIYDDDIQGGHLGVYCDSQRHVTWSNLEYSCNDHSVPQEVYDDLPLAKQANIEVNPFKPWSGTVRSLKK